MTSSKAGLALSALSAYLIELRERKLLIASNLKGIAEELEQVK
jgi:hypothetical protein